MKIEKYVVYLRKQIMSKTLVINHQFYNNKLYFQFVICTYNMLVNMALN